MTKLKSVFLRAQELEDAARAEFLAEACADDPDLRAKVEEMLADSTLTTRGPWPGGPGETAGLQRDQILEHRFQLERFLGRGGMGEVYVALDLELGGRVALKTVRSELLADQATLARFRREIQLSRQVTHPNICRVFDLGRDESGLIFLTMEFLEGETLAEALSRRGTLPAAETLALARQIAAALGALHEKGIVHRDLKPSNVMISPGTGGERAVLMDFGLARGLETSTIPSDYTQTGLIIGTPAYMAPEQLNGQPATMASDVYAFGLLVFEMLTGRRASLARLEVGHMGLPRDWETVIAQCTARNPADRPKSATEAMAALGGEPAPAVRLPRSKRWWWAAAALAVALGGSVPFVWPKLSPKLAVNAPSANEQVLKARELLDRYYQPEAVDRAVVMLQAVAQEHPQFALGQAWLGRAHLEKFRESGEFLKLDLARATCERAAQLDADLAEPHVTLGLIYLEQGKHDLASSELRQAQRLDPRSGEVHQALARLYEAQGRTAEVEREMQQAIDLAPDDWHIRLALAQQYRRSGKYEAALEQLEAGMRASANNPVLANVMGTVYLRQNKLAQAAAAFEQSLQWQERDAALQNLGAVYHLQGQHERAAEMYRRSLKLAPSSYLAWANLAAALDAQPGKKAEAREAYQKAIELGGATLQRTPKDAVLMANLASYQAALGNRAAAVPGIRRALALAPDSPDVARRAAETYELLKQRDEALHWVEQALRLGYALSQIQANPDLAELRRDPRYAKLESQAKLASPK
jgi:tetratricopeptide (TPR) repeat protein